MRTATGFSVAQALETDMKRKVLEIGVIAAAALAGGWALAQTTGHGPGGFGAPFMRGTWAAGWVGNDARRLWPNEIRPDANRRAEE
jgi:hypothetical protein